MRLSRFAARYVAAICAVVLSVSLTACTGLSPSAPYVDLGVRTPLPAAARAEIVPLRIAVAAILSPQGTAESYDELADYLEARLERPVELVQRRTYGEVNQLIASQDVDLGFVCTSAYVDGHAEFGMELLVAPQMYGALTYHSALIVPATSTAVSMADLRGSTFAFTDPISFSGRVYPTYMVQQLGSTPEQFFNRTFFTYSHDKAIEAVAAGVADGAAVDSLVLNHAVLRDAELGSRIRVIQLSEPFGIPPVVVSPDLAPRHKVQLQEALLAMHQDEAGRRVLDHLGIDRFVIITDDAYVTVRQLTEYTGAAAWAQPPSN